jgi:hypothetical protein
MKMIEPTELVKIPLIFIGGLHGKVSDAYHKTWYEGCRCFLEDKATTPPIKSEGLI